MTDAPNLFDVFAEAVKPSWAKTRERALEKSEATRAKSKAEKQLDEDEMLERLWLKGETQRRRELLSGTWGVEIKALVKFLKTLTLADAPKLIDVIEAANWISTMPNETRIQVLRIVDRRIGEIVRDEGLPYPDDAMPGEEPRAYQVIRDLMGVR